MLYIGSLCLFLWDMIMKLVFLRVGIMNTQILVNQVPIYDLHVNFLFTEF